MSLSPTPPPADGQSEGSPRVLRLFHSAVVEAWRARDRELRSGGVDVELISAREWVEGGQHLRFAPGPDDFASAARTWGHHPNAFVYDPRPLWRKLRSHRWDVIDVHEEPCSLAAAEMLILARLAARNTPLVFYSAQNIDKRYPLPFRLIERWALRQAAGAYVCNAAAGRILARKGLQHDAAVIPLGVDTERFSPRSSPGSESGLRIGYVGRLDAHKGVHTLIDAIADQPGWLLDVIGGGPELAALREQAGRVGAGERVRFLGAVAHDLLAEHYRSFDVVAVPSIPTPRWDEQFCRVAVEAMASGVPVVAGRTGALPEVVGPAGLLFTPGDPEALSKVLDRLATEPPLRCRLREEALRRAAQFSWPEVARQHAGLYREAQRGGVGRKAFGTQRAAVTEVLIVAYGAPELLRRCLDAIAGGPYPVTVVDNSSSPEVRAVVAKHGARYLDPRRNLGFAGGVNWGLAALPAGHDVLLLNPDAMVEPEVIGQLEQRLNACPALCAVAPAQTDPDGHPARVAWPFPTPARMWLEAIGLGRLSRRRHDFLIGSVLLLRGAALSDVGPLDERYFLYAEEIDWQRRATSAGWRVALAEDLHAVHVGAGTGGDARRRETYFHASHERYLRKHFGPLGWQTYRLAALAGAAVRSVVLPAERGRRARFRLWLYLRGPVRFEQSHFGVRVAAGAEAS